ncbi:MAG: hypothetical protein VX068_06565, partial [Candidatus Thermoplasmatota archaeon]|nr:hypothetical protein [Candidatus Thermoplasmatota archaeon]
MTPVLSTVREGLECVGAGLLRGSQSEPPEAWFTQRSSVKHVVQFGFGDLADKPARDGVFQQGVERDTLALIEVANSLEKEGFDTL